MEEWIISCNLKYYDVIGAFKKFKRIDWKQSTKSIQVGDVVYIYVGMPLSAVKYKCRVNKVNLPKGEIDSEFVIVGDYYIGYGNYMELELLNTFDDNEWSLSKLRENGLIGNIQGPRRNMGVVKGVQEKKQHILRVRKHTSDSNSHIQNRIETIKKPVVSGGVPKMSDEDIKKMFPIGGVVHHKKFGDGVVKDISDGVINIKFMNESEKELGADFCIKNKLLEKI